MKRQYIKVGVVLHPLSMNDFLSKVKHFYPMHAFFLSVFGKRIPPYRLKEYYSRLKPHKVFTTNWISVSDKKLQIIAVMCPLFPEQLVLNSHYATKLIANSIGLLAKGGVKIITLAGFSSIVTSGGNDVVNGYDCNITTGNTLTAALTIQNIRSYLIKKNLNINDISLAIIGATGDIGSACARNFAKDVRELVLCSRGIEKDNIFKDEIKEMRDSGLYFESDVNLAIKNADVVITATSAFGFLIDPKILAKDVLICDVSMPPNVPKNFGEGRQQKVTIIEGGRAKFSFFSDIKCKPWSALFPRNAVYGCLAEAIALALDGQNRNFSLGKREISEEKIREILEIANRNGICLAEYAC